jgi:pSer/pThr/pTyr-binding forkhead associated (FHA) protein
MLTLRSIDGQDPLGERVIRLGPGDHIPVGRSSKNQSKGIMARKDNAYIDSPVVSREHAVFTAELSRYDTPMVFLKDKGSMHGTKVNSMPLKSNEKYTLRNGDELEIGSHVVRDRGKPSFLPRLVL